MVVIRHALTSEVNSIEMDTFGKIEIRIQEASNSTPVNYEKFVVGETIALRQNYEKIRKLQRSYQNPGR